MSSSVVQSYPPIQSPVVDLKSGIVSPVWSKWFNQNYIQSGGSSSTTLTSLIQTVAALTLVVNQNTADIKALQGQVNGLGVGRQL